MITITVEKKIAQLEARIAKLEGYSLLEKKTPRINYTLEPLATDLDFFRDPDQIKQSLSDFMKTKKLRTTQPDAELPKAADVSPELLYSTPLSKTPDTQHRQHKDKDDR